MFRPFHRSSLGVQEYWYYFLNCINVQRLFSELLLCRLSHYISVLFHHRNILITKKQKKNPLAFKNLNLPSHAQTGNCGTPTEGLADGPWLTEGSEAKLLKSSREAKRLASRKTAGRGLYDMYTFHSAPFIALAVLQNIKPING
jgi:hypothetical protein